MIIIHCAYIYIYIYTHWLVKYTSPLFPRFMEILTRKTWALYCSKMLICSINGGHKMLDCRLHGLIQIISDGAGIAQFCHRCKFDDHLASWALAVRCYTLRFFWNLIRTQFAIPNSSMPVGWPLFNKFFFCNLLLLKEVATHIQGCLFCRRLG